MGSITEKTYQRIRFGTGALPVERQDQFRAPRGIFWSLLAATALWSVAVLFMVVL